MKITPRPAFRLTWAMLAMLTPGLQAHDNLTIHPMLTQKAYKVWAEEDDGEFFKNIGIKPDDTFDYAEIPGDADSLTKAINNGSGSWNLSRPAILGDWLVAGSIDEDAPATRCLAHFYDPIHTPHHLTDPITVSGRDSFQWASTGEAFTHGPGTNAECDGCDGTSPRMVTFISLERFDLGVFRIPVVLTKSL